MTVHDAGELVDAAAVHAARAEVVRALGPLAASPLDEHAAAQMRAALERVTSPAVRAAVRRLARPEDDRPTLSVVRADGTVPVVSTSSRPSAVGGAA